ncbi:MAG: hypothetical protein KME05_04430 [Gloeocapsa sp. UFS-A4-WI-NPMV-4B04]|jgi:hypothetical protein|nr:hypothetical protein [Gloeocapsa sp. UFS-A4-WI-NPMV-4B04]
MTLKFKTLIGILLLTAVAPLFDSAAIAQPSLGRRLRGSEPINTTFERAFFKNDPEFFRNRSPQRQIDVIFGVGSLLRNSFTENEIRRDAELVDIFYRDLLNQQVGSDPIIRTPDLQNPYSSSILLSPNSNVNNTVQESEVIFESQPSQ